ncbi:ABC transporter ATP-binding protein [Clostridia bacterium]|nr:ABC transporter ATP-binding protein [Clostridia bacterium]
MSQLAVKMVDIRKTFPGVVANDQVNLEIYRGEIHALLGENGAGKSTLMNILTGLYQQDKGDVYINGEIRDFKSPKEAIEAGIGMVHQNFRLVKPFTVTENVMLGQKKSAILKMDKTEKKIKAISEKFKLEVNPTSRIWQLSVGEQQRVEIIKMLYKGADILILDEPTAVLTPQEVNDLFGILRGMADDGKAIVFITHKMHEVMDFADRITVLRNGISINTLMKKETSAAELGKLMVGKELTTGRKNTTNTCGLKSLYIKNVSATNDKGLPALQDFSLHVCSGEIVGIAGVAGNGQRELSEVITGLRPITEGSIELDGEDLSKKSIQEIIDKGVAFIPEDRHGMGLAANLTVIDNALLKEYRSNKYGSVLLNKKALREKAQCLVDDFDVKIPNIDCPVKLMSGGNLQKLLLARETSIEPKLVVAVYPIRGLDIGATDFVHDVLIKQKNSGAAVLLISEDLDEIYKMADRIAVMYEGQLMGELPIEEAEIGEIGMMMAGAQKKGDA